MFDLLLMDIFVSLYINAKDNVLFDKFNVFMDAMIIPQCKVVTVQLAF